MLSVWSSLCLQNLLAAPRLIVMRNAFAQVFSESAVSPMKTVYHATFTLGTYLPFTKPPLAHTQLFHTQVHLNCSSSRGFLPQTTIAHLSDKHLLHLSPPVALPAVHLPDPASPPQLSVTSLAAQPQVCRQKALQHAEAVCLTALDCKSR